MRDRIAVAPLREAVLVEMAENDLTWMGLAVSLNWLRRWRDPRRPQQEVRTVGDAARLKRALGALPQHNIKRGRPYSKLAEGIDYSIAVRIARAAGVDPVDIGA